MGDYFRDKNRRFLRDYFRDDKWRFYLGFYQRLIGDVCRRLISDKIRLHLSYN